MESIVGVICIFIVCAGVILGLLWLLDKKRGKKED